ncbi:alpha/beta fold hydrolase [Microcella sp.]|uniref:alpha/beta fold hydrolase n=1 Tax=Microcella sp. TaxID=1913979 RepID=UPI00256329AD|nr:alpha/beta hydrolase [Microcella sp.]MBX9472016.1 alpha/beta hydrolase [Microcella sp.]
MPDMHEFDLTLPDGRTLHGYDSGSEGAPVMWHHGTPNTGAPPKPLLALADELGLRWVSFDRPGYGGSTAHEGRTIATVAADAAALADSLGLDRFAVVGHSGGGPHALGCAAAYPERVSAVVTLGGLAPFDAEGLDWFAGMGPTSTASLRAAVNGLEGKRLHEQESADAPIDFTARDWKALTGPWSWLGEVAAAAGVASGIEALIADDLAYVTPWGVDLEAIIAPVLLAHGADDHVVPPSHSAWLAAHLDGAEHWQVEGESHISSLDADEHGAEAALRWLSVRVQKYGSRPVS